jgi:hypothetical protein
MGSSETTDPPPRAPREAAPIPAAQLDLDQRSALFSMQRAFADILHDVGPLSTLREAPPARGLPRAKADARRTSRLMLIDGGRGSGKTSLMLTLLAAWDGARGGAWARPEGQAVGMGVAT